MGESEVSLRDTQFLGIGWVLHEIHEDFSRLAAPMTRLTRKEVRFDWDDQCEEAFQDLRRNLTTAPILIVPGQGMGVHSVL